MTVTDSLTHAEQESAKTDGSRLLKTYAGHNIYVSPEGRFWSLTGPSEYGCPTRVERTALSSLQAILRAAARPFDGLYVAKPAYSGHRSAIRVRVKGWRGKHPLLESVVTNGYAPQASDGDVYVYDAEAEAALAELFEALDQAMRMTRQSAEAILRRLTRLDHEAYLAKVAELRGDEDEA